MMHKLATLSVLALSGVLGFEVFTPPAGTATDSATAGVGYEIHITNVTPGQVFSPATVALHSADQQPLWTLGQPASPELYQIAEDAIAMPMQDMLAASPAVGDVGVVQTMGGPIPPGHTGVGYFEASGHFSKVSLVGMLVTTNDAFYGLNGVDLPRNGSKVYTAIAYDAGSEANTEDCDHIPGPPCGNPMVRFVEGAEGFVHVHSGIHGIADLNPSQHDWGNPVARIEIRRVH